MATDALSCSVLCETMPMLTHYCYVKRLLIQFHSSWPCTHARTHTHVHTIPHVDDSSPSWVRLCLPSTTQLCPSLPRNSSLYQCLHQSQIIHSQSDSGPIAPISVNCTVSWLTHLNYATAVGWWGTWVATWANSSSVKWVSQLMQYS